MYSSSKKIWAILILLFCERSPTRHLWEGLKPLNTGSQKHVAEALRMQKKSQTQWWLDTPQHVV